jgi:D-amino peptidase
MRVYISIDAEGCTGIVRLSQVMRESPDYDFCRRMMEGDVNSAVRGAFSAGAEEVIVNDAHNFGDNVRPDNLDPRAKLICGDDRPLSMMEGISSDFKAAMLLGYHSRKGASGVIAHTYDYDIVQEVRINGEPVGESEINGFLAGHFGVPVVFLSGDQYVTENIRSKIPGIRTVVTKRAIGCSAAECLHPEISWGKIEKEVCDVLAGLNEGKIPAIEPLDDAPYALEIQFTTTGHASYASWMPGLRRISPTVVSMEAVDFWTLFNSFRCAVTLASAFNERK